MQSRRPAGSIEKLASMPLAAEMEQGTTYLSIPTKKPGHRLIDRAHVRKAVGEYINVAEKARERVMMGTEHIGYIAGDARPAPACRQQPRARQLAAGPWLCLRCMPIRCAGLGIGIRRACACVAGRSCARRCRRRLVAASGSTPARKRRATATGPAGQQCA